MTSIDYTEHDNTSLGALMRQLIEDPNFKLIVGHGGEQFVVLLLATKKLPGIQTDFVPIEVEPPVAFPYQCTNCGETNPHHRCIPF